MNSKLKTAVLISCFIQIPSNAQTPNIVTLNCVDDARNYEMVVRFDENLGQVFGRHVESKITTDIIYYKTESKGNFFKTYIYRSTGRYTVVQEGTAITFGGTCQVKQANRF